MKVFYGTLLAIGLVLLLATEGSLIVNVTGLILFAYSASRLGAFDCKDVEEA